jgi:uncharacterized protein YkwD
MSPLLPFLLATAVLGGLAPPELERASGQVVAQVFERGGRRTPLADARLDEAARTLAREALRAGSREATDPALVGAALSDAGASDPHPRMLVVRASSAEEALEAFRTHPDLGAEAASHLGVGVAAQGEATALVALLVERHAALDAFPRRLERAPPRPPQLCGRLEAGLTQPRVFVTRPGGGVEQLPTGGRAPRFCAAVPLPGDGLHEVEVVARGAQGPRVVALLQVHVGPGPRRAQAAREAEPRTPAEGRAAVVARVNALRAAHGLAPLAADPALDAVAQAYSERMAREGFFAHVAPDGSDLRGRLSQAGYAYRAAGENLGLAPGPLAAQRGVETSPAHRGNLLSPGYTRIGVGLAVSQRHGQQDVVLTQVFAEPLAAAAPGATGGDPLAEAYGLLGRRREAYRLPALRRSEALERIARDHAARAAAAGEPSAELPGSVLHERAFEAVPELARVTVDLFVAESATALPDSANLVDPRNRVVGLGVARGDSARFGPGRAWVVIVYGAER